MQQLGLKILIDLSNVDKQNHHIPTCLGNAPHNSAFVNAYIDSQ
jgi:hypothetical protein